MSRDWQEDMTLAKEAANWQFDLLYEDKGNIVETVDHVFTHIVASDVGVSQAGTIFNALEALPYWLKEVKGLCEVNQQNQREILNLRIRLSAEKEHAEKLREALGRYVTPETRKEEA